MVRSKLTSFKSLLGKSNHIGLDSMCFIYHFADHTEYAPLTQSIFDAVESHRIQATTSIISLLETLVMPEKRGRIDLAHDYEHFFKNLSSLAVLSVDWQLAKLTARLRAQYPQLKIPDLIQLSAALINKTDIFITNDKQLSQFKDLQIIQLSDYTTQS